MKERKCPECGTVLTENVKECPKCGCIIEDIQQDVKTTDIGKLNVFNKEIHSKKKTNFMPVLSLIIGIITIILGCMIMNHKNGFETYSARTYNADNAAFGADFYTEIYKASDIIVDELSDINGGMEIVSNEMKVIVEAIYYGCGMIVIAIGLGTVAISLMNIGKVKE